MLNIQIYSNPTGKIYVTFFKWCLCVIRSLLNQMLFVTSMNVSSDTPITEEFWIYSRAKRVRAVAGKTPDSPHSIISLSLSCHFSLSKHPSFSPPNHPALFLGGTSHHITWPLTSPTALHSIPVPRLPWLLVVIANKRISDKLCSD